MPTIAGALDPSGRAVVDVQVAVAAARVAALLAGGLPVPGPFGVSAMLDPGASITCLDTQGCQALSLVPSGRKPIYTPTSGPNLPSSRLYRLYLAVLHPTGNPALDFVRPVFTVAQTDLAPFGIDVLIGRDVLTSCRFVYDGPAGTFSLAY